MRACRVRTLEQRLSDAGQRAGQVATGADGDGVPVGGVLARLTSPSSSDLTISVKAPAMATDSRCRCCGACTRATAPPTAIAAHDAAGQAARGGQHRHEHDQPGGQPARGRVLAHVEPERSRVGRVMAQLVDEHGLEQVSGQTCCQEIIQRSSATATVRRPAMQALGCWPVRTCQSTASGRRPQGRERICRHRFEQLPLMA